MFHSTSVRTKLLLLVALPLMALLALAGTSSYEKHLARSQANSLGILMAFATEIGNLAHNLQTERGLTVGFLSSSGVQFEAALQEQRTRTDDSIRQLEAELSTVLPTIADHELHASIDAAWQGVMDLLPRFRAETTELRLPSAQALQSYSALIQALLDIPAYSVPLAMGNELISGTLSYVFLLEAKESAGQTRALLNDVFVTGRFTDDTFQRFVQLYTVADLYSELFLKYANEETRSLYRQAIRQEPVQEAQRLRLQAMSQARAEELSRVDPAQWFQAASAQVNALKQVEDHLREDLMTRVAAVQSSAYWQFFTYLLVAGAVILLTLVVALMLVRVLSRALARVREGLGEVARSGDLRIRVDVLSRDEIGEIGVAFNAMLQNLQKVLGRVTGAAASLNAQSEQLAAMSRTARGAADRQKGETHQSATAMNEMTATVQEVARNTHAAAQSTQSASQEAGAGRGVVTEVMNAIEALASEVQGAETVITGLKKDSEAIDDILRVIRDVAEQTNLLALNAAIEAARAGEQGRGFAVVADEVRILASRTNASTQEIQKVIEQVQGSTARAVAVMERSREQAQWSVQKAADAGASLERITGTIGQISDMNVQIASASEEQSAVAEEINRNIQQIHHIAEENAASTVQLQASSQELERLAQELQTGLAGFRI